eukprot:SAG31_NODE_2603_length_5399_cov_2.741887_5_plen_101_part_00
MSPNLFTLTLRFSRFKDTLLSEVQLISQGHNRGLAASASTALLVAAASAAASAAATAPEAAAVTVAAAATAACSASSRSGWCVSNTIGIARMKTFRIFAP